MTEALFVAAFLGGLLSLLAPCSALLLPMFFAYAFTSPTRLLSRTLVFFAGLSTVFVPLGMGASLDAALLIDYRESTIVAAGVMLIGFGLLELTGKGFSFLPDRIAGHFRPDRGVAAVYGAGLVYGLAGFCSGPLLSAVLTVAASTANWAWAAALLFTYSAGTAAPLFVIALLWDRYRLGQRAWLRGRAFKFRPLEVHSTKLVAGLLFISLGVSFIAFQGGSALSGIYADLGLDALGFRAQLWIADNLGDIPDPVWLAVIASAGGAFWIRRWSHRRSAASEIGASR